MLNTIVEAAKNFCRDQLGIDTIEQKEDHSFEGGALVAYIDISMKEKKYRVYLAAQKEFVQFVASVFLEEETSDDETIMDMAMECTNLIVGSAKVIGSKNGLEFSISTPKIERMDRFTKEYEESILLGCEGKDLFIALNEIKG
jgi:CheY-specific phosphatase CheX